MERNNDDLSGSGFGGSTGGSSGSTGGTSGYGTGSTGSTGGTSGFGTSGDQTGSAGYGSTAPTGNVGNIGTTTDTGTSTGTETSGITDRARNLVGNAGEKLADVGSSVRERAGTAKTSLADMLETGAEKLRGRTQETVGADGSLALTEGRTTQVNDRLASGMQSAANLLRDTDLDGVKTGIERQVRENPARSLLVAVGLGYLLGKALRR